MKSGAGTTAVDQVDVLTATPALDELDAGCTADALVETRRLRLAAEATELVLVAHWCDEHNADTLPERREQSGGKPGRERAVSLGGDGTPEVAEFTVMELAVLLRLSTMSARSLMRDALDVRHRHPLLWAAVQAGEGPVWQARKIAKAVHAAGLSLEQARWVDAETTPYLATLPWGRFLDLIEAKIIAADPANAEARARAAAVEQFVATGRHSEYGLKTLIARGEAGDVILFVAMCDRIAQILLLEGHTEAVGVRRAAALRILANPAEALALLGRYTPVDTGAVPAPAPSVEDDPTVTVPVGEHEMHPCENDADDTAELGAAGPAPEQTNPFVKPSPVLDPAKLRPDATLYLHISEESFRAALDGQQVGVARAEGIGPITIDQVIRFLRHRNVKVTRVLDPAGLAPVDGYEVPDRMAEAVTLLHPVTIDPYGTQSSRGADKDHSTAYVRLDAGGKPGQTRVDNIGPMGRFAHRVKTHGKGWRHSQPAPGVYHWTTPQGYRVRVDQDGTHWLGKKPRPDPRSAMEKRLAELIPT